MVFPNFPILRVVPPIQVQQYKGTRSPTGLEPNRNLELVKGRSLGWDCSHQWNWNVSSSCGCRSNYPTKFGWMNVPTSIVLHLLEFHFNLNGLTRRCRYQDTTKRKNWKKVSLVPQRSQHYCYPQHYPARYAFLSVVFLGCASPVSW